MNKESSGIQGKINSYQKPFKFNEKQDFYDRRRQEMKRRFVILQSRRNHLERELEAIKACLISLDQQMSNYGVYKQLKITKT